MRISSVLAVFAVLAGCVNLAEAQDSRRFEAGGHVSVLKLREPPLYEGPGGLGGRFGYNLTHRLTLEAELTYFPQNPSGNFGETQGLFGVKAGQRWERFGLFAKARPGFVHFGGDYFRTRYPSDLTKFALDLGAVLEYYPRNYLVLRMDSGDTIIAWGRQINHVALGPQAAGTRHNWQTSFGIGVRF